MVLKNKINCQGKTLLCQGILNRLKCGNPVVEHILRMNDAPGYPVVSYFVGVWSSNHVVMPKTSSSSPMVFGGARASSSPPARPEPDRKEPKSAGNSRKTSPNGSTSGSNPSVEFKKHPNGGDRYEFTFVTSLYIPWKKCRYK